MLDSNFKINLSVPKRIVIKIGTRILVDETGKIHYRRLNSIVKQIVQLKKAGHQVILVSSGAIGAGLKPLKMKTRPQLLPELQMSASVGQLHLMFHYQRYFSRQKCLISQTLLTHEDLKDRERHLNARNTLLALLKHDVIPIINENDAVSVAEIQFGDNDKLAALVSLLVDADLLLLLSSPNGLYNLSDLSDLSDSSQRIPVVSKLDNKIMNYVDDKSDSLSTGGMKSKLQAVKLVTESGVFAVIISGLMPNSIAKLFKGDDIGTLFLASNNLPDNRLAHRKRWLRYFQKPNGAIVVDHGAAEALLRLGKSLLPVGIKKISGKFKIGDLVIINTESGELIAQGLIEYDFKELDKIIGCIKSEIIEKLGEKGFRVAIHRDNLVLLD